MDAQEIRAQVESMGTPPSVVRFERIENSEDYIGPVFGEKSSAPAAGGLALRKALGLEDDEQSGCDCTHCECGR